MSPMSSWYKELGIELIFLGEDQSHYPKQPPMVDEKIYNGVGHPIKFFLEDPFH